MKQIMCFKKIPGCNLPAVLTRIALLFVAASVLTSCSAGKGLLSLFGRGGAPQEPQKREDVLTREAMDYFSKGRFLMAEEIFQKIKDRYPFSSYATLAELRLADCKFFSGSYEEAIPLYEEFEKLHPTHEAVPYAIFQEGTCYYKLMASADRDQSFTRKIIGTYQRLLNRYPDSPYSFEAKRRIQAARNRLAAHELVVARWYIRTRQFPQARARLERIKALYPDTAVGAKADNMLREDRLKTASIAANKPEGPVEAGRKRSWWRRLIP